MSRYLAVACCWLLSLGATDAQAQLGDLPLSTFGYFQTSFQYRGGTLEYRQDGAWQDTTVQYNAFSLQQLNLFFQTDLATKWRAFVNFEVLNNFSSSQRWGSFNLEEAWLRYRGGRYISVKVGLHIPIFNHLNEIKNRTPLLPYIIRPLVYETSFGEFLNLESFVPSRAFLQAYGYLPLRQGAKLDYAAYLGNSPGINSQFDNERNQVSRQTGIDTTATILVGGRLGLRHRDLKLGVSATHDVVEDLRGGEAVFGGPPSRFESISRIRLGADFKIDIGPFFAEAEAIKVIHNEDVPDIDVDKVFYYFTLGYYATEQLVVFAGFWNTKERDVTTYAAPQDDLLRLKSNIAVPNIGVAYTLLDRITFKAHYAPVRVTADCSFRDGTIPCPYPIVEKESIHFFATAVSVLF